MTFKDGSPRRFGEPSNYIGTSMAAAHVSGVAAMVLASGMIDAKAKSQGKVGAADPAPAPDRPRPRACRRTARAPA